MRSGITFEQVECLPRITNDDVIQGVYKLALMLNGGRPPIKLQLSDGRTVEGVPFSPSTLPNEANFITCGFEIYTMQEDGTYALNDVYPQEKIQEKAAELFQTEP